MGNAELALSTHRDVIDPLCISGENLSDLPFNNYSETRSQNEYTFF